MTRQKRPLSAIQYLVLHHTAANDKYSTHESLAGHIAATNLGYHATVDDDDVFKIKAASQDGKWTFKQQVPLDEVVWGATGCNYNALHLAVDGNTLTTGYTPDELKCVIQVFAAWAKQLGWRKKDVVRIVTHQYVGLTISRTRYFTECPGKPLIDQMPYIREQVAKYLPA